jgi:CAAX protease family protein
MSRVEQTALPPPGSVPGVEFAGVGRRLLAAAIDGLFWFIATPFAIGWIPEDWVDSNSALAALIGFAYLALAFNYFAVCEWRFGQTIGKNATGIRVLRLDRGRMTWNTAAIRNLMLLIDLPLMLIGVGLVLMGRSPRRQRLGDRAAGTVVVRVRAPGEDPAAAPAPQQPAPPEPASPAPQEQAAGRTAPETGPGFPWVTWGPRLAITGGALGLLFGGIVAPLLVLPFDPSLAEGDPGTGGLIAAQALLEISLVGVALWVAGATDPGVRLREALSRLGARRFHRSAWGWAALAMVSYIVLTAIYSALVTPPEQDVPESVGFLLIGVLIAPVAEEAFFRGMLFGGLRRQLSMVPAAAISGVVFGAVHFASGPAAIPPLAILGFVLCLLYERTGSLLPGLGAHTLNNALATVYILSS